MKSISRDIVEVCKRLHLRGMLAAADGNVSVLDKKKNLVITPSGINKGFMKPDQMALMTLDNKILKGNPSGERLMHLEVYRHCPSARAVVHAHPPTAVAWSVARPELNELPTNCLSEVILGVGKIPIVPYARPLTQDMGSKLVAFLPEYRVMILARHGALCWGETLEEAYNGMERLEHSALVLAKAHALGALSELPENELEYLRALRATLGGRTL